MTAMRISRSLDSTDGCPIATKNEITLLFLFHSSDSVPEEKAIAFLRFYRNEIGAKSTGIHTYAHTNAHTYKHLNVHTHI